MQRRKFLTIATVCGGAAALPAPWMLDTGWPTAEAAPEASPIVCNQLGYLPNAAKVFTLRAPSAKFSVRSVSSNAVVLEGRPTEPRDDAASGDRVQLADVSSLRQPGTYILETDAGKSAPFAIGADVYRHALWLTMRGYYG